MNFPNFELLSEHFWNYFFLIVFQNFCFSFYISNCLSNIFKLLSFQLLMFLSNISFQPSKPSFELSLQLLNFLLKIFKCKILLYNIQPFFFWIVIFLALFQMFILYVCSCDAHLDFWIFFFFIVVAVVFSFVERTRVFRG